MGAGKSTVGALLAARGAPVVDADRLARELTAPGTPGHAAIVSHFGAAVTGVDGTLDRRALAATVFSEPALLAELERLTHPLVRAEVEKRLAGLPDGAPLALLEIPLLDGGRRQAYGIDLVVLVTAPEEVARGRAVARGFEAGDVAARQRAQPGADERRSLADWVVDNGGSTEALAGEVARLWQWLLAQAGSPPA
jgi:dephospho-CoA kinase